MFKDSTYDKIKILHELSKMAWFIKQHCKSDETQSEKASCYEVYEDLQVDLEKYIKLLKEALKEEL